MAIVSRTIRLQVLSVAVALFALPHSTYGQSSDSAQSRMRPIGSGSAVDQYRPRSTRDQGYPTAVRQTDYRAANQFAVRQAAMMQDAGGMTVPNGTVPNTGTVVPNGPPALPPGPTLPTPSAAATQVPQNDQTLVPRPQLANAFATQDNCNLVTPASGYSAAFGNDCGTVVPQSYVGAPQAVATNPMTFAVPPAEIARPAIMPPNRQGVAPIRSLFTLGQEVNSVQVGQGLWGQPKAYVIAQPLRNWVRYFFP